MAEASHDFWIYRYVLDEESRCLIWLQGLGDNSDGFVVDDDHHVLSFESPLCAQEFALSSGLGKLQDNGASVDFDELQAWMIGCLPADMPCSDVISGWNFLIDVASSVGEHADEWKVLDKKCWDTYNYMFFHGDIPNWAKDGEHPERYTDEIVLISLRRIFALGIRLFRERVKTL